MGFQSDAAREEYNRQDALDESDDLDADEEDSDAGGYDDQDDDEFGDEFGGEFDDEFDDDGLGGLGCGRFARRPSGPRNGRWAGGPPPVAL